MLKSVDGVDRDGKVELLEAAPPDAAGRVIVTCLPATSHDAQRQSPRQSIMEHVWILLVLGLATWMLARLT